MDNYTIDVALIEELQMISNTKELNKIFSKAMKAIVGGQEVILSRFADGRNQPFDIISTEADLAAYKDGVFKYL
jgi:hypothetical protein